MKEGLEKIKSFEWKLRELVLKCIGGLLIISTIILFIVEGYNGMGIVFILLGILLFLVGIGVAPKKEEKKKRFSFFRNPEENRTTTSNKEKNIPKQKKRAFTESQKNTMEIEWEIGKVSNYIAIVAISVISIILLIQGEKELFLTGLLFIIGLILWLKIRKGIENEN